VVDAMSQILSGALNPEVPPSGAKGDTANMELDSLLLRCSELTREVARIRRLVTQLTRQSDSYRPEGRSRAGRDSARPPGSLSQTGATLRRLTISRNPTPVRSELARACRIALMDTDGPVSVETIYDRIERRESFTFAHYKHPFRAIVLAMGAMVRTGEVRLVNDGGRRRWRWVTERAPFERPTPTVI